MREICRFVLAVTVSSLFGGVAHAAGAIGSFASQADFLSAVRAPSTDTLDSLAANSELGTQVSRTAGAYTYSAAATGGLYSVSGSGSDNWLSTNAFSDTLTLSQFSSNVFAVGGNFFGTDSLGGVLTSQPSQAPQTLVFNVVDVAGNTFSSQITLGPQSTFFGVASMSAIASVSIYAFNNFFEAYPTINNLTLAAAVPEPASYLLLAAGLICMTMVVRRSSKRG